MHAGAQPGAARAVVNEVMAAVRDQQAGGSRPTPGHAALVRARLRKRIESLEELETFATLPTVKSANQVKHLCQHHTPDSMGFQSAFASVGLHWVGQRCFVLPALAEGCR